MHEETTSTHHLYLYHMINWVPFSQIFYFHVTPLFQPSDLLRAGILHWNVVPVLHCAASVSFLRDALPCLTVLHRTPSHFSVPRLSHSRAASVPFPRHALLRRHASRLQFVYRVPCRLYRISPKQSSHFTLSFLILRHSGGLFDDRPYRISLKKAHASRRRSLSSATFAASSTTSRWLLFPGPSTIALSSFTLEQIELSLRFNLQDTGWNQEIRASCAITWINGHRSQCFYVHCRTIVHFPSSVKPSTGQHLGMYICVWWSSSFTAYRSAPWLQKVHPAML
jgi:hypothetical protein